MTEVETPPDGMWRRILRSRRVVVGGAVLLVILLASVVTLRWTVLPSGPLAFNQQELSRSYEAPGGWQVFGADQLGRSMLGRSLLGGAISLGIGVAAALLSTFVGTFVGLVAGYRGGWVDAVLMRTVDVLYGLPYILLILLFKLAFQDKLMVLLGSAYAANLIVLFLAIGSVSWLTMARVIRGQVLSLRGQPFIEAARAVGLGEGRIFAFHLLPNLVGPITVYATLIVPSAILQESFLSFLGVGIQSPVPTWGSLAADGLKELNPLSDRWWLVVFPCALLALTLLSLNFVGDGLRDVFDPKREAAKV